MGDVKFSYYETSAGYRIVGKSNDDVVLAGGGTAPHTADAVKEVKSAATLRNVGITVAQLNSVTLDPGIYNAQSATVTGLPGSYHYIIQLGSYNGGGYRAQIAIPYQNGTNQGLYMRVSVGSTWGSWERQAKFSDITTAITDLNLSLQNQLDGKALANGSNATNTWVFDSYGLKINGTAYGKALNSAGVAELKNATYGETVGIINSPGIAEGNPTSAWFHRIKMLHNNVAGYYTEIAVAMTGEPSMWYKQYSDGVDKGWIKLHDNTTITPTDISNWNGTQTWVNTNFIPKSHPSFLQVTQAGIDTWNKTEPKEYVIDPGTLEVTVDDNSDRITVIGYEDNPQTVTIISIFEKQYYTIINLATGAKMTVRFPSLTDYDIDENSKVTFYITDNGEVILMDKSFAEIWT